MFNFFFGGGAFLYVLKCFFLSVVEMGFANDDSNMFKLLT